VKERSTIALVTTSYPITGDGSEAAGAFVADLVETLAEHVDVRVVAPGPRTQTQRLSQNIQIFRFRTPEAPLSTLKPWRPDQLIAILRVLGSGQKALDLALKDRKVCHIFALWALPSGHWARHAGKKTGVPYSVWTLGSDIWSLGRVPLLRIYLARILKDADKCYSDGYRLARDTEIIARRPVVFLPSTRKLSGIRTEKVRISPPFRLLFLGRWHQNKGIDLLFGALRLLEDEDWRSIDMIKVYGGGPLEDAVKSGVRKLYETGKQVELGGYLSKKDAELILLETDFLIIPSRIESIPVVFSDAMKLGCPVISTPVGDLSKLVSQFDVGVLAKDACAVSIRNAISNALRTGPAVFASNTEQAAALFDLGNIANKLVNSINHS